MESEPGDRVAAVRPKWWEQGEYKPWNGVFQGGGAKGAAYAGALDAVKASGHWFAAVAGSSAGAITAALIAAGMEPAQMRSELTSGLESIKKVRLRHLVALIGAPQVPLYHVDGLAVWLEGLLQTQQAELTGSSQADLSGVGRGHTDRLVDPYAVVDLPNAVTFRSLFEATGIELYVVSLDIDGGAPVVLSHHNARDCQVTAAVLASSAIPVAMPYGRLALTDSGGRRSVARMVDGGGWANYPRFVFADESFTTLHGNHRCAQRPTVGFALDIARDPHEDGSGSEFVPDRFVLDAPTPPESGSGTLGRPKELIAAGFGVIAVLSGFAAFVFTGLAIGGDPSSSYYVDFSPKWARISAGILAVSLVAFALVQLDWGKARRRPGQFLAEIFRKFLHFAGRADTLRPIALIIAGIVFVSALGDWRGSGGFIAEILDGLRAANLPVGLAGYGIVLAAAMLGAIMIALVLLSAMRFQDWIAHEAVPTLSASLGAATRLPRWAGQGPNDHLIRVPVTPQLETTEFRIADDKLDEVIDNAREATRRSIEDIEPHLHESPHGDGAN